MRSIRALSSRRGARPLFVAVVALLLVAGTAWAASPSVPPASPPASLAPGLTLAPASPATAASPEAPESPEASESPEPSEAPKAAASPEAAESPEAEGGAPSAAQVDRVVSRLSDAGISTTAAEVQSLTAKVGLGGAVRVLAFAHASGKTPAQILDLFQSGTGWGAIGHQLGLSIGPGIGWIMGRGHAGKSH